MAETTTRGTRVRESLWGRFRRLPAQGLRSAGMIIGALGSPAVLRYGDFLKMVVDVCLMALAAKWSLTTVLGHEFAARNSDVFVLAVLASRVPALGVLRVWKDSWRQARSSDMGRVALGVFLSLPLLVATMHFAQAWGLQVERVPILLATESVFCLVALAAVRFAVRRAASAVYEGDGRTPVLIVGAGAGGAALAYLLEEVGTEYRVVGYLDDDPYKRGRRIRGHRVTGSGRGRASSGPSLRGEAHRLGHPITVTGRTALDAHQAGDDRLAGSQSALLRGDDDRPSQARRLARTEDGGPLAEAGRVTGGGRSLLLPKGQDGAGHRRRGIHRASSL